MTEFDAELGTPEYVPSLDTATNVYAVPTVRPSTMHEVAGAVTKHAFEGSLTAQPGCAWARRCA